MFKLRIPILGRRGASLLFFGMIFSIFSWSYLAHPELISAAPNKHIVNEIATPLEWGIVFALAALVKFVASCWKALEWAAFGAGEAIWTVWALSYATEWVLQRGAYPYVGLAFYAGFAAIEVIIAGWPESGKK